MADDDNTDDKTTDDKAGGKTTDDAGKTSDKDTNDSAKNPKDDDKEGLRSLIREELQKLYSRGDGGGSSRRVDLEARAEQLVQEAAARLQDKQTAESHAQELTNLKEQVKALSERPPIKQTRLSRALWGDASKDQS